MSTFLAPFIGMASILGCLPEARQLSQELVTEARGRGRVETTRTLGAALPRARSESWLLRGWNRGGHQHTLPVLRHAVAEEHVLSTLAHDLALDHRLSVIRRVLESGQMPGD